MDDLANKCSEENYTPKKIIMKSRTGVPVPESNSCTRTLRLAIWYPDTVALPKDLKGLENYNLTASDPQALIKR